MKFKTPLLKLISSSQFIVAAVMLLLLPLLAALQYRWLGQLSVSDREQRKAHLRTLAASFGQDFDREITRTYVSFLPFGEAEGTDWLGAYAANYDRWSRSAAYPGMVENVFVVLTRDQQPLQPHQLNHETRLFEIGNWPPEMTALRDQLQELARREAQMQNSPPPGSPPSDSPPPARPENFRRILSPFSENPTALVIPMLEPGRVRGDGSFTPPRVGGFAIVELDLHYIQQEMLPALARRHFLAEDGSSYDLTIVSQNGKNIIYNSGASPSRAALVNADADAPLFGLRTEELRDLMRNRWRRGEIRERINRPRRAGSAPPVLGPREWMEREQASLWQVHIRHRAGSLDAAVASVRRRNLLISFGILALLAASVTLMMLSSRRAHRLAQQQMDFVAGISHELRTPLAVIESAAFNLDKGVVKDPGQIKNYGTLIRKETGRLTEMIEQVLEFAGVQSGRQRYDLLPVSLSGVIEDVLAASQPLLAEGEFEVETNIAHDLPTVMADAQAIARAIQNLLNNAMKYSGDSRWIGLSAETVTRGREQLVQITVKDHGQGIPDEELPHIFEPFYRGSEARSAQIRGNGLGLSLVKNIIEAHGGQIQASSKPGAGSTFFFRLPVMNQASELKTIAEIELQAGLPSAKI
jgi:signal transduction histidine kinase